MKQFPFILVESQIKNKLNNTFKYILNPENGGELYILP